MEKLYQINDFEKQSIQIKVCNECGYPMMKLVKTEATPAGDLKTFLCPMCNSLQGELNEKS